MISHRRLSFIWAKCHHLASYSVLPLGWEGLPLLETPKRIQHQYTWTCSSQDAQPECHHSAGGLLTRLLTLTSIAWGGCFLLHYSTLADSFWLGSGMPLAARTFLWTDICGCGLRCTISDRPSNCFQFSLCKFSNYNADYKVFLVFFGVFENSFSEYANCIGLIFFFPFLFRFSICDCSSSSEV